MPKSALLPRLRLALDLHYRGEGADDVKFLYDYGRSTEWNAWENERVLKTITKLETPCNFERWVKLDAWTMQQATCIIIGVEPDVVLGITGLYWFRKDHGYLSEGDWHIFNECVLLTCKLDKIFLELRGSYLAGKLQIIGPWDEAKTLVAPSVLTDWAKTKGYAISPALADISINTPPTPTTEPDHDQQVEEKESTTITLQTIPGTAWGQIRIRIAKNDRYEILRPGFQMEFFNAHELGLQKARTKLALLKAFGLNGGELKKDMTKEVSPANMSNLRKHISGIFAEVKGDPIPISEDGRYVCQFQICVNEEEFSREHYTSDDIAGEGNDWEEIMGAQR